MRKAERLGRAQAEATTPVVPFCGRVGGGVGRDIKAWEKPRGAKRRAAPSGFSSARGR